jgi:hypothetical protein
MGQSETTDQTAGTAGSPSTVHVSIFDVRVSVGDSASLVVIGNFPVGLIVPRVGTFAFFARA